MEIEASSSPSDNGEAIVEPEHEAQRHAAKRVKPDTQLAESEQIDEEHSCVFDSVTARFHHRAVQADDLKRAIQQWCNRKIISAALPRIARHRSAWDSEG
ncbi:hypothetical protein MHU86_1378 [Fragilaria crotonensis]|nr:hypothetical protein MHU86_1378 [Fragilaria crotonensis]